MPARRAALTQHPEHAPMTVIALVLVGNLLLAGLFSLAAVALD